MTPTVIRAETRIFGLVKTEWYCINSLRSTPHECRVSRDKGRKIIQDFGLRLAYKDQFGEVYAGEDGCFARFLALKDICKDLPKAQAIAYEAEKHRVHNFLKNW